MGLGNFARNIQPQSETTRRTGFAPMFQPPHQGIKHACQRCALDGRSTVTNVDMDMRFIASHIHAPQGISCPVLEGVDYKVSEQLLQPLAVPDSL